jgi:hypothetical protein
MIETSVAPSTTPDWYVAWQRDTAPDMLARQQRQIQVVGDGEAFFRTEIVVALKASGVPIEQS